MPDVTIAAGEKSSGKVTLVANQVSTVTMNGQADVVSVVSDGTAEVWYCFGSGTPTVGGKNCYPIWPAVPAVDTQDPGTRGTTTVKLISTGTPTVVVVRG